MKTEFLRLLWMYAVVLVVGLCGPQAGGAELHGRITDSHTGHGIPSAAIRLAPEAPLPEVRTWTDAFGFYRFRDLAAGSYTFEASHPAYAPHVTGGVALTDGQHALQSAALDPIEPHEPHFDVDLSVACATTGLELGGVPVRGEVIPLKGGTVVVRQGVTDAHGFCTLVGLPIGSFTFRINEGAGRRAGWDTCVHQPMQSLHGPHRADVFLEPEERTLIVSVYGYDPVEEEDGVLLGGVAVELVGVHPDNVELALVPAQVGVSGLRKPDGLNWNNDMAGKVRFAGLPPVHWLVTGKRLGYEPASVRITTDAGDQLVPSVARLDMALMDTKLTAVLTSPYEDAAMLDGIQVRLQGLANSNTEGIDRKVAAAHDAANDRTVAAFDRLLPGTYRLVVNGAVTNKVPILVEGRPLPYDIPSSFTARMTCEERVDAVAGRDTEENMALSVEPALLRGRVVLVDTEHPHVVANDAGLREHVDYPAAGQPVELRVSEYYQDHVPPAYHARTVTTDFNGEFLVSLLPGLYGVVLPGLDDYWGAFSRSIQISESNPNNVLYLYTAWPSYQRWPHSYASLQGYGFLCLNSDRHVYAELEARQDRFQVVCDIYPPPHFPARRQVLALYRQDGTLKTVLRNYPDWSADGVLSLIGGTEPLPSARGDGNRFYFEGIPPGLGYRMAFTHPRFRLTSQSAQWTFDCADRAPAGLVPPTPPTVASLTPMEYASQGRYLEPVNPGSASFTVKKWDSTYSYYATVATRRPDFLTMEYTGDRVFEYDTMTPPTPYVAWVELGRHFDDGQEHWCAVPCDGGNLEQTIYIGGARAAESAPFMKPPLRVAYDLRVVARNYNGTKEELEGVQVTFTEGGTAVSGGPTLTGRTLSYDFNKTNVVYPGWIFNSSGSVAEVSGDTALVTVTVYMQQRSNLRGRIVNARTESPVSGAAVRLVRAQGQEGEQLPLSKADGSFSSSLALWNEVHFLEVAARGYVPHRLRLATSDLVPGGTLALEGARAIRLEPLPPPEVLPETITFDRFGAFLPGVKKAGNQDAFRAFTADGPLTMTWTLKTRNPTNAVVEVLNFDTLDDQPGGTQTVTLEDEVTQVWLIDARGYTNNPDTDIPVPLVVPNAADPHEVHDWLTKIGSNHPGTPNVFHRRRSDLRTPEQTNIIEVTGQLKLWQLPPDEFKPVFVAVTQRGAVALHAFSYTGEYAGKELVGFRRPQWLGAMGDTLGLVAGSFPMVEDRLDALRKATPVGRFMPLPKFTADIYLRATRFLDYTYALDVNLTEGMTGTGGRLARLLPGRYGLDLLAGIEATLKGEDKEFYLQLKGGAGMRSNAKAAAGASTPANPEVATPITPATVNRKAYAPGLFKDVDVTLKPPPGGSFFHVTSEVFGNQNEPREFKVLHGVDGQVGVQATVNLVPALATIPTVGPVLLALNRSEGVKIAGRVEGAVGLRSLTQWTTQFPQTWEHDATMSWTETRQPRRHFLGGTEVGGQNGQRRFDLCFRAGVGIDVDVMQGLLGGSGTIALAGYDCWTPFKALYCEGNTLGDWPPIKRIRGDFRLEFDLYLNAWWVKYGRHWDFPFMGIDHQFGTETQFHLFPMNIVLSESRVTDFDPATFDGRSPQLVRQFLPLGKFSVADGALAYLDMLEGRERMGLRFSLPTGPHTWSEPVLVAQTRGVLVDACLAATPGGPGWMAVWTEIPEASVGSESPSSVVWCGLYDTQTARWGDPVRVVESGAVAQSVRLVPFDQGLALVYLETEDGLLGRSYRVLAAVWDGTSWGAPQEILNPTPLADFAVAGTSESSRSPLHFAFVDETSTLRVLGWDGRTASAPETLGGGAGHDVALAGGPDGLYLTWSMLEGGIGLLSLESGTDTWKDHGVVVPSVSPQELQLTCLPDGPVPVLLHTWTQGGNRAGLWCAYTRLDGEPLVGPVDLTAQTRGHCHAIANMATTDQQSTLFALFTNDGTEELRQFDLQYPVGAINTDRDQDGLDDRRELLIVDADPRDGIRTIDDVHPEDDFDQDGFSNQREVMAGSHPGDAEAHPAVQVLLEPAAARVSGARWRVEGGEWMASAEAIYLLPGEYQIEFQEMPGWTAPPAQPVFVIPGAPVCLICPYVQSSLTFDEWNRSLLPALPDDRQGPDDLNGPLGLANFVAYALGVNPMTASPDDLPVLRRESGQVVYTYRRSKTAYDVGLRVYLASGLASEAWAMPDTAWHRQVGETDTAQIYELRFDLSLSPPHGFLRFEVWRFNAQP